VTTTRILQQVPPACKQLSDGRNVRPNPAMAAPVQPAGPPAAPPVSLLLKALCALVIDVLRVLQPR
jgi:hypothetical protein